MAKVHIEGDDLVVVIEGLNKLWALKSTLTIPLANVRGATADPGITREPAGFRSPGTHLPGTITAGTYRKDGERSFWNLRHRQEAVVIELTGERFSRLVLGVDDARATADRIERALSPR